MREIEKSGWLARLRWSSAGPPRGLRRRRRLSSVKVLGLHSELDRAGGDRPNLVGASLTRSGCLDSPSGALLVVAGSPKTRDSRRQPRGTCDPKPRTFPAPGIRLIGATRRRGRAPRRRRSSHDCDSAAGSGGLTPRAQAARTHWARAFCLKAGCFPSNCEIWMPRVLLSFLSPLAIRASRICFGLMGFAPTIFSSP